MRKKVLYAASTFGHLRSFHIPYMQKLMEQGYEVHAMGAGDPSGLPDEVKTIPMPFEKKMGSLRNFVCAWKIRQLAKREGYDMVSVHTALAAFFTRLGLLCLARRPWVVNTSHGYLFDEKTSFAKRMVLLAAEKLTRPVTDVVAVMNRQDYDIAKKYALYRKELVFLGGMGFDPDRFQKNAQTDEDLKNLRQQYAIGPEELTLICVAEFSARKNQAFLIGAMEKLKKQGIPCHLILAGDGEQLDEIKALADSLSLSDRIHFPGYTRQLAPFYYLADVSVSASRIEGLPFQIMEAMACQKPVIATHIKGHEDLVTPGENGFLYEFNDVDAFCDQVRRLYCDRSLLERMGQKSFEIVQKYRLEQVLVENMRKLYPQK